MIDLDYNATTPLKTSVRESMEPFLNGNYGNPSSIHRVGQRTKAAVEDARELLAESLGTDSEALVITGSGSEANTMALRSFLDRPLGQRRILSTPVEHSSVKDTLEWLEKRGTTVEYAPMTEDGQPDPMWFEEKLDETVDLVSVMMVNNETGVEFPVGRIGELAREHGVVVHTDAVQAYGKIPFSYRKLPVDLLSVSAHKIGGPKGTGALVAPKSFELDPLVFGGHQERDRRGGTENVAGVVGFGAAADAIDPSRFDRLGRIRDDFERTLKKRLDGLIVAGEETRRVGNTSGLLLKGIDGEDVVMRLDMEGVAVATGSACTSGSAQPSHVLRAIPLPDGYEAESFVRFSLPPDVTRDTMEDVADLFVKTVRDLRTGDFT